MNIENIISFIYVYRYSSFSKAAEALYITQPSLTSRIKTLEKDLGTPLFIRDKKEIELTKNGEVFLPYALQIYDSYSKAKSSIRHSTEKFIVGSIISVSTSFLPNTVHQFQLRNPNLSVDVITAKTKTIVERLLNGECQIAITEKVEHPDIVSEPIYRDPISLFVSPTHYFARRNRNIAIEEIALEPLICFNPNSSYWASIEQHFQDKNLTPNIVFKIDSIEAAKSSIINGLGICFLPELSLERTLSSGQLSKVSIHPPLDLYRELSLIYLKEPAPYVQEFSRTLRLTFPTQSS